MKSRLYSLLGVQIAIAALFVYHRYSITSLEGATYKARMKLQQVQHTLATRTAEYNRLYNCQTCSAWALKQGMVPINRVSVVHLASEQWR
jgi:hypothetical protein